MNRFRAYLFIFILLLIPASVTAWVMLSLFAPHEIHQTDEHPLDVVSGDINNDGYMDILTANREGRSVSVFIGNGDGTLTAFDSVDTEHGATSLALAHLDDDEMLDIVVSVCSRGCTENAVAIFRGLGNGQFKSVGLVPVSGVPYNISVADFNLDGIPDIAASDYPGKRLMLLEGLGDLDQYEEKSLNTGKKPIALLVGDLNSDGRPDLISSDHGSAASSVYLSLKEGNFSERQVVYTGELPYSIALARMDDDDTLDLIVAHSTSPGKISIHTGDGNGNFSLLDEIETEDRLIYVEAHDFNNDGSNDVVVTRHKDKYASVYLNQDNGYLEGEPVRVEAENQIYSLAVADLNGDPYPDLVTVDYEQNTLSVSLGLED